MWMPTRQNDRVREPGGRGRTAQGGRAGAVTDQQEGRSRYPPAGPAAALVPAGAGGFLLKDATFPELLHAVRVVADGQALLSPDITGRLIAEFTRQRVAAPPARSVEGLTTREVEVLVLIARGLSNGDIADRLTITAHTVKTRINRLFAKMELRDRAQAVILAYEPGLVVAGSGAGGTRPAGPGAGR
ncbi:regulatory LuxR family protein [Streptomyces sp. CEV 2-1]|uniref:LuxR C-terminal-related transcriptional regulator n=1 Tax=Streptomyces sp. CEV 2-1 TaxID=2485153 RepID=UPI000F933826|nr:response regulator transcription factor [Streptomyces sp. CEV 2-1]ROQ76368.1 regulatory LuxR family protein [Streptomyces sp. CEV 2-1]